MALEDAITHRSEMHGPIEVTLVEAQGYDLIVRFYVAKFGRDADGEREWLDTESFKAHEKADAYMDNLLAGLAG